MLEISGRGFLLPSQMDLEDHFTTLSNISEISEMIQCFGEANNKKSAMARFSRNDPVIHETQLVINE